MSIAIPNQNQLPLQFETLVREDARRYEVEQTLAELKTTAAHELNLETLPEDMVLHRLGARMLETRVILTASHALQAYPPSYARIERFANLLHSTRDLAQKYKDFHPRAEDRESHIAEGRQHIIPFSYGQLKLMEDSLIEMWVRGDGDAQARAEEVLVGSLFPGQSKASRVLHPERSLPAERESTRAKLGARLLDSIRRGHMHRNAAQVDPAMAMIHVKGHASRAETLPPLGAEPDIIPLDELWLSPGEVAATYSVYGAAQGMALLRILMDRSTGSRSVGVFVRVPTRGRHHAGDQEYRGEVRIVPFKTGPEGNVTPDFRDSIELPKGGSWSMRDLTGVDDGSSVSWRGDLDALVINPGTTGSAEVWGPQSRLFAGT